VIWIEPPAANSPVPVAGVIRGAKVRRWGTDHPLGAGLRTKDLEVDRSLRFEPAPGDAVIAEADQGPVVVARRTGEDGAGRTVVLGFHPMQSSMRNALAAPLLFANIVQWMKPGVFREWELNAGSVGTVSVPIEDGVDSSSIEVTDARGDTLPFTIEDKSVRFYSGRPGIVRVMAGNRELVYSLSLPATSDTTWEPADSVLRGVPRASAAGSAPTDLWPWLALAGIMLLIVEWVLFGRFRRRALTGPSKAVWRRAA
jgi:hypothetical protein